MATAETVPASGIVLANYSVAPTVNLGAAAPSVITTNYTPNLYAYSLAFLGGQTNYAAAIAVLLGGLTVVIAYVVQLRGSKSEVR